MPKAESIVEAASLVGTRRCSQPAGLAAALACKPKCHTARPSACPASSVAASPPACQLRTSMVQASLLSASQQPGYDRHLFVLLSVANTTHVQGPPCSTAVSTAVSMAVLGKSPHQLTVLPRLPARQPAPPAVMPSLTVTINGGRCDRPCKQCEQPRSTDILAVPCGMLGGAWFHLLCLLCLDRYGILGRA